jgi:predicted glutamine amidotransferase
MCKLFGAVVLPERVPEQMIEFRHHAVRDRDGWGIAWYDRGKLQLVKSRDSALENHKYVSAARDVNSRIMLAHLRRMTRGNNRDVNAHPFSFGNYVFAHNGTVDISDLTYHLRGKYRDVRGDTDSEVLFRYLMQNMEKFGHFMGLRKAVQEISDQAKDKHVTSLNFLMADGRYLYAFKRVYRGRNNLYYMATDGFYKSVVFTSRPFREDGWSEMENGEFIAVDSADMSVIRTSVY